MTGRAGVTNDGRGRPPRQSGGAERSPAGMKILVPGYAQWSWQQRERALVLFGSFVAALGVGAFAWGTRLGLAVLFFAFTTHVVSAVDVIRQSAFPGFGRWVPVFSSSGGLAIGVYMPTFLVATALAWPATDGRTGAAQSYLVNCWAFHDRAPNPGEWVWLRSAPAGSPQVGRVVAGAGQEVDWSRNRLSVDGAPLGVADQFAWPGSPQQLSFVVPEGHVVVHPEAGSHRRPTSGLVLVPRAQIAGRAWALMYPVWERQLLR